MFSEEGGPPVPIDDLIRHISHQSEESEDNDTIEFPIQKQHKQLTLDVKVAANDITTNQPAKNRDSVSIQNIPSGKHADPILCQEIQTNRSSEKLPTILPQPLPHVVSMPTVLRPRPERQISIPPREIDYRRKQQDPPCRGRPDDGISWPDRDALSFSRSLMFYGTGTITEENERACKFIQEARHLRNKYFGGCGIDQNTSELLHKLQQDDSNLSFSFGENGVVEVYASCNADDHSSIRENLCKITSIDEYVHDYKRLVEIVSDGAMRSFCFKRLQMLSSSFKTHITANNIVENEAQNSLLGTDFYRTMKVDNHIHLAAASSAKTFVDFVRNKLKNEGDVVVLENGLTLNEVFCNAGLDTDHLTIDAFNVLADYSVYQRFDNFNGKYSPFRSAQLRKIFLKVDNHLHGRYFAELTKIVLARHEASKGHVSATEMRLSIYGMERTEWQRLACWILHDWPGDYPGKVLSTHNRWLVQVPRLWRIFCSKGEGTRSFQDMLENLFSPLFEATLYPDDNPEIAEVLKHIVGFDSVDDEGSAESPCSCSRPSTWREESNPAYAWQLYYLWANIEVLNRLRISKGLNTFSFRPHAGETGDVMHLAATYMLCKSINHGIKLHDQVALQYLYYLDQVGLSICPLSNNFLFRKIASNPFPKLFKRGLNVTLSTDDPLLFHMSDDALLEEYSVARATFDLSMTDISEIARNSVLQSDFEMDWKKKWLGDDFIKGINYCDELKTHVPLIRSKYRSEHLAMEQMLVSLISAGKGKSVLREMMRQFSIAREAQIDILLNHSLEVPQDL